MSKVLHPEVCPPCQNLPCEHQAPSDSTPVKVRTIPLFCANYSFFFFVATSKLVKQVTTELKLEQKPAEDLVSGFTSFELKLDGSLATLVRKHDQEQVKIQLDANSAIEAGSDDMEFDEEVGEEGAATDDEPEVSTEL